MGGDGCSELLLVLAVLVSVDPRPCPASGWAGHGYAGGGVGGFRVDDRVDGDVEVRVDTGHGGVAEDREVLECHVDPLLRLPVGEGECLPSRVRVFVEEADPVLAPGVMKGVELFSGRHLLQVGYKRVERSVSGLQESALVRVGADAMQSSAEVAVGALRHARDRLR